MRDSLLLDVDATFGVTMKISENLRARAAYIAKHGFSFGFDYRVGDEAAKSGPCCFVGSGVRVLGPGQADNELATRFLQNNVLQNSDGWPFSSIVLQREGWNTDDAVAALDIAADIAECEGL